MIKNISHPRNFKYTLFIMEDYTEELDGLNPLTTYDTFQKTQTALEELSASALHNSRRIEERIDSGQIGLQIDDEGHFARLKSMLNQITSRYYRTPNSEEVRIKLIQRTKELQDFMDNLLFDHNTLFLLVEKLARSQKKLGLSLAELGHLLENTEQGKTYSTILDSILHKFITSFKIQAEIECNERPNVYCDHIQELNMLHEILAECNVVMSRRMHLCLGCWKLVSFGAFTLKKYKNFGFKGKNYPLLISLKEIVEVNHKETFDEPEICLKDIIYFLWYTKHEFLSAEAKNHFSNPRNQPEINFMPFPLMSIESKKKPNTIAGIFV